MSSIPVLLAVLVASSAGPLTPGDHTRSVEVGGTPRPDLLHLPPALRPPRPLRGALVGLVVVSRRPGGGVGVRHRLGGAARRRAPTLDWFAERGVTYVTVDAPPADNFQIMPPLDAVTNPSIAYLRAHGRNTKGYLTGRSVAERFAWQYTDGELEEIASRARTLAESSGEVHVAFNNNRGDDAPTAAQRFRALLGQEVPEPDDPQLTL